MKYADMRFFSKKIAGKTAFPSLMLCLVVLILLGNVSLPALASEIVSSEAVSSGVSSSGAAEGAAAGAAGQVAAPKPRPVNTIARSKKTWFYFDSTGRPVKNSVIRLAVSFVRRYAKGKKTRLGKLKACYRYIVHNCRYRAFNDPERIGKMPSYAAYMFETHTGNCYRGAAALTYAAKVLGYETRMGIGGVTAYADHALSTHGWTEVKVGKNWYICDTSMQRYHPDDDLFMVPRKEYPYRLRIDKTYRLTVKNGKVRWK